MPRQDLEDGVMLELNQLPYPQEIISCQTLVLTMILLQLKIIYLLQNKNWDMYGRKQLSKKPNNHQETILCPILDKTKMLERLLEVLLKWNSNMDINGMLLESLQHHLQEITQFLTLVKITILPFLRVTLRMQNKDLDHGTLIEILIVMFSLKLMLMKDLTQFAHLLAALSINKRKLLWVIQLTIQFQILVEIEI